MPQSIIRHHVYLLVAAAALALACEATCGPAVDPETKNYYHPADLAPFSNAAEWVIFSLDPEPWEDPFAEPAPKDGSSTSKPAEPKRKVPPEQGFHGYPILGQTKVAVTDQLKSVISTLDEAGRHWSGAIAACFFPRHGIRVTKDGTTYDLLICYECMAANLFRGTERTGAIYFVTDSARAPRPAFLNGALIRAKVKMPPPAHH